MTEAEGRIRCFYSATWTSLSHCTHDQNSWQLVALFIYSSHSHLSC